MRLRFAVFAAVAAFCSVQPLGAESPADVPAVVTEADFLAAPAEDHPAFTVLEERVGLARAAEVRARTFENPEAEIEREDPSGAGEQLDLTLSWQLPRPGRRRLSIAAADRAMEAAEARVAGGRLDVRLAMRRAFAEWAVAAGEAEILRAHVSRLAELAERERRRAERGESSGLEARRLALAVAAARSRLALVEATRVRARAAARIWRPDLPEEAAPALPALAESSPGQAAEHPRIVALAAELAAARLARDAAERAVALPRLMAGWQRQRAGGETLEGPLLGLAWTLPIADRRRAERIAAAARVESAAASYELALRQIEAERSGAAAAYARLAAAANAANAAAADHASMVEAAVAAFRLGEAGLTDLLEILRSTTDAERAALDLHASALAAYRELEAAAGHPLEPSTSPPVHR